MKPKRKRPTCNRNIARKAPNKSRQYAVKPQKIRTPQVRTRDSCTEG